MNPVRLPGTPTPFHSKRLNITADWPASLWSLCEVFTSQSLHVRHAGSESFQLQHYKDRASIDMSRQRHAPLRGRAGKSCEPETPKIGKHVSSFLKHFSTHPTGFIRRIRSDT